MFTLLFRPVNSYRDLSVLVSLTLSSGVSRISAGGGGGGVLKVRPDTKSEGGGGGGGGVAVGFWPDTTGDNTVSEYFGFPIQ